MAFVRPASAELLNAPPRGLSLLQCQADANQCRAICDILYDAELRNNAVALIADGTFGLNFAPVTYCIDRLTSEGRHLTIVFYAHSGPAARAFRDYKKNPGWAAGIDAATLNKRIVTDPKFQAGYQQHVNFRIRPLVMYAIASGATPVVTWLEDNFTTEAFVWFLVLTHSQLSDLPVVYSRNHVQRFSFTPPWMLVEKHTFDPAEDISNGITFNDGFEVRFLWEIPRDSEFSLADLEEVQYRSGLRGNIHINWFGQYQGSGNRNPILRKFRLPRPDERVEIIKLLRSRPQ